MIYVGHPDQHYGHITYSQHGEDLMLCNIFKLIGIDKPSYLDLGAHHPVNISNTCLLYDRGSRGVNVEANINLMQAFNDLRPEDFNLNIGVGSITGMTMFYMYDGKSGRNTFSREEVETLKGTMEVADSMPVMIVTLDYIVLTYCEGKMPDLLTMDIEGMDYEVLQTTEFKYGKPKVIVVETRKFQTAQMRVLLREEGYFLYCRMGENLIFIHDAYHDKVF